MDASQFKGLLSDIDVQKEGMSGGFPQADEEGQFRAETIIQVAAELLASEDAGPKHMQELESAKDFPVAAGKMSAELLDYGIQAHEVMNYKIPPDILMDTGAGLVNLVFELATAAGLWEGGDTQKDSAAQEKALKVGIIRFGELRPEMSDPEMLRGLAQEIEQGKYDDLLVRPTGLMEPGQMPERSMPVEQPNMMSGAAPPEMEQEMPQ